MLIRFPGPLLLMFLASVRVEFELISAAATLLNKYVQRSSSVHLWFYTYLTTVLCVAGGSCGGGFSEAARDQLSGAVREQAGRSLPGGARVVRAARRRK